MKEETPIFETVAPGEVYILTRIDDCVEYIANIDGDVVFKKTCLEEL
jgi:hypothetical protein